MKGRTLRLVNFLLDSSIFFILLILFILAFKNVLASETLKWITGISYFLYYFLFEYIKGQTIGKMITNSKVVSYTDNDRSFVFRLFIRTLMRLIPIDILSYLFSDRGLHDIVSKTSVVTLNEK